jgi:transposase
MVCCAGARRLQANRPLPAANRRLPPLWGGSSVVASVGGSRRRSCAVISFAAGLLEPPPQMAKEELSVTIPPDLEAQILRYYHVEKWPRTTIARQLHVHRQTVARVLAQAGLLRAAPLGRPSKVAPFMPFIIETLEKFPTLAASRLYAMIRERGYDGRPDYLRHVIARHRPRSKAEAYLRLRTLPGEQAQVDWATFGHLTIGRAKRPLMAFVMVLSYSRMIYLRFFFNARMENFLRGHAGAFAAWGGVPRVLLYDNLKSAVLERRGEAIRFNPTLLEFASNHRFEPRPVAVARGNEKGRVERAIRYVRDNFFAARQFADIDDLNVQAEAWCSGEAARRLCPEDRTITVQEAFAQEAPRLLHPPEEPYPLFERIEVKAGKTPYVRFDLNDYSIPHSHVRKTLTVFADLHDLRVLDGQQVIARHKRSYDKGAQIEDQAHIQALVEHKRAASLHRAADALVQAAPASRDLLVRAAERGASLAPIATALMQLLERYGAAELQAAILDALRHGARPHPRSVRLVLERRRQQRRLPPPVAVALPEHVKARDAAVRPHDLGSYDNLGSSGHTKGVHDE